MNLFATLPVSLFNPLASSGAPIYSAVLLVIFEKARRHHQPLSRELVIDAVREVLADGQNEALQATVDAEDAAIQSEDDDPFTARAGAIVRYLTRCGWLRPETQSDFSQSYTLPDYAFRLLNVFSEIASDQPLPLQGLIFSIYSLLQTSIREGNAHISLPEAHRQTISLMSGLKELQHNIGRHIEQVLQQFQTRDILKQTFTQYRDEIVDKAYHQLRTTDHVSRFRPGVLEALTQLSSDEQVMQIAQLLRANGMAPTVEAAASRLLEQIRDIRSQFEQLDHQLQAIDVRHSQFIDSAVRAVELRLTANTTTSGQLHAILTHMLETYDHAFEQEVSEMIDLYALSLLDQESLSAPSRSPTPFVAEPVEIVELTPEQIAAAQNQTLAQLNRSISRERVRRFAAELLGDREQVQVSSVWRGGPENLPLLIYLRYYGDGSLGYRAEEIEGTWIEQDGIGFRDLMVRKA
jgi:hypothetical protein